MRLPGALGRRGSGASVSGTSIAGSRLAPSTRIVARGLAPGSGRTASWLISVLAATLVGLAVASISPSVATLLVIAIAITIALPLVIRAVQGKFDPFEPIVFFVLSYGTMFVVRPAAMIGRDEYYFLFAPYVDIRATFDEMLVLALLGALAFVLGYFLPLGRQLARRAPRPPRRAGRPVRGRSRARSRSPWPRARPWRRVLAGELWRCWTCRRRPRGDRPR